ncbi:uncharacterized protein LOC119745686 [Patiria miniata]|uniref:Uncharacterized protein n=1 Tax=Patiria miniata TaxID=46514 RepID=A0A914BPE3_PATMI|nr:uncharacterized protein LOC119745686 [Patiria miniata]XP_038078147.1 uncharacterized protein LOC119745686 [Patiria miniata]XP_038078148.1 uncharacterized protein LOC119745686 [Patiria miniata]
MSHAPRQSPRRRHVLRPIKTDNLENANNNSSDPDADPDVDVTKMKTLFERTPKIVPFATPRHPPKQGMEEAVVGRGNGALGVVRNRLEKTLLGGDNEDEEKHVSPSLRQLRMTPGRALQKQKILERKHHEAKSRAHNLGVGGGVSLWPQMDNMRLSQREVAALSAVSLLLIVGVAMLFQHLHGAVVDRLKSFNKQLAKFSAVNKIEATSQEDLDKSVLGWHLAFTNLMDSIHIEFDPQWLKIFGMYHICAVVYIICIALLLYYLAENVFTSSRLTPHRIKIWVSLLVVTGTWSLLMVYLLSQAQQLETRVEANVQMLSNYLSDLVFLDLNLERYKNVLLYWQTRCLPPTTAGTLSIMGLLQVRDVAYYLQYYSLPILTALVTPVVRLMLALKEVYSTNAGKK